MRISRVMVCAPLLLVATGTRAGDWPRVSYLGTAAQDVIELTVQTGRMIPGHQEAFEPKAGQTVDREPTLTMVRQDGQVIGYLVGPGEKTLYYPDRVESVAFDAESWDSPNQYQIQSKDDPNYENAFKPTAVYRKSKPAAIARTGPWKFEAPFLHTYFLRLPRALAPGKTYILHFSSSGP